MTRVALLDHGMGNLRSVAKALEAAGAQVHLTSDADMIDTSDALCVPGQGIFGRCVENMQERGLDVVVKHWLEEDRPFLGICLGMQVLFPWSEEGGGGPGLGIFDGKVVKLSGDVPVPHIGWNTVSDEHFYFDHSYAVLAEDESLVTGWCEHGIRFAARIQQGNALGVQFHPEKSSNAGIALLGRWLEGA